jgi:hypothetical protein
MPPQQSPRLFADGTFQLGQGRQRRVGPVLLSRGLCRIRSVPLAHVPPAARPRALQNVLQAWSPFEGRLGWQFVRQEEGCLAIAWDADRIQGFLTQARLENRPVLCETLARDTLAEGCRLVKTLDGFEAQRWESGRLLYSRWWPQIPAADDWALFLRAAGVSLGTLQSDAVPMPVEDGWRRTPFARLRRLEDFGSPAAKWERLVVGASAVALAVLSGAQARQASEAWRQLEALRVELDGSRAAAQPVTATRQRVEAGAVQVERLAYQMSSAHPLEVLAHLSELLPSKGALLRELDVSGLRVRVDLDLDSTVSRSTIIAALQRSPWFVDISEIREAQARGTVPFEFRLRGAERPIGVAVSTGSGPGDAAPRAVGSASSPIRVPAR